MRRGNLYLLPYMQARFLLVTIGSSLVFGTVNVKMLRACLMCHSPRLKITKQKWVSV